MIFSVIVLALLFVSTLTLAFNIRPVKAGGTIYIRVDGSIDPETAPISTLDNITYTFVDNIYDSLVVERNDIVIDGNGYTLQGPGRGRGISLFGRENVTILNAQVKAFDYGIYFDSSSHNSLSRNNITEIGYGIFLGNSSCNTISGNNITDSSNGIYLGYGFQSGIPSNYNIISGNNIVGYSWAIYLDSSSNNDMSGNNIAHGGWGFLLDFSSSYNSISGNNISSNDYAGLYLGFYSNYNIVSGNNIADNNFGIKFSSCYNNSFCHNCFVNNIPQIYDYSWDLWIPASINTWDNGYEGNYWGDYNGIDSNSDGIGDTPFIIYEYNTDHYPLIGPWTETGENVAILHGSGVSLTFENVTSGGVTTVDVTDSGPNPPKGFRLETQPPFYYDIKTRASYNGNITIAAPYNDTELTLVEERNLKLMHWNEASQQWTDITTRVDFDKNIIYGDTSSLSAFAVMKKLIGDVNTDGEVSILDVVAITSIYGSEKGDLIFKPISDINYDEAITILDVVLCTSHYGEEYP
jgi:parallel beta-helix repeat protein